jgi:hypothetical protein
VSSCFTRLSAAVSEFLRVLWFSRFQPEVVSGTKGHDKLEVMSSFDSSTPLLLFCVSGLLTSFVFFRSKVIQRFRLDLKFPLGLKFWGFWGILDPLAHACINETPKCTSLRQTASFKPLCMFVRCSVRPLRDCKKKNTKKFLKKKVAKSLYFTYSWGRPHPTNCDGSLNIGLGHQRNQQCQFW